MFSDCPSWASLRPSAFSESCGVSSGPSTILRLCPTLSINRPAKALFLPCHPWLAITCTACGSLHVLLARLTISPCSFLCADNQLTHLSRCCFAPLGCFLVCTPAPRLIVLLMRSLDCHAFWEMSRSRLDLQSRVRLNLITRSSPQQ